MKAQLHYTKKISNLIGYCFGAFILLNLAEKVFPVEKPWADLLVILPAIVGIALAPVGLYFAIKGYKEKDANQSGTSRLLITFAVLSLLGLGILLMVLLKA